jgi:TrmH family RNA methyltransferase
MPVKLHFEAGEPPLKWLKKIAGGKHQLSQEFCLVEGWKSISEAVDSKQCQIQLILHTRRCENTLQKHPWHVNAQNIIIENKDLAPLCSTQNPEGVLAVVTKPQTNNVPPTFDHHPSEPILPSTPNLVHLGLYQWRDPSNVGAVIRTARGLGIRSVTIIGHGPDFFSTKVIRCSMGSVFHMHLHRVPEDHPFFSENQEQIHMICATAQGKSSRTWIPEKENTFLMIGSESHGFPETFSKRFTNLGIPLQNNLESLSAPIASTLMMEHLLHPTPQ